MATVDLRLEDSNSDSYPGIPGAPQASELSMVLDFAETNRDAADVLQLFRLKANTVILEAYVCVVTAEGATATFDLKTDEGSPQTLLSNANGNAAGTKVADGADGDDTSAAVPFIIGTTDCNITLTVDHAMDTAKYFVYLRVLDMDAPATSNFEHAST